MGGRRKDYKAKSPAQPNKPQDSTPETSGSVVMLSEHAGPKARNATGTDRIDLSEWDSRGVDTWISAICTALASFVRGGTVELSTVVGYGDHGAKPFLAFLTGPHATTLPATPAELEPSHIKRLVAWLKLRHPHLPTAKTSYQRIKALLTQLIDLGHVAGDPRTFFPRNPFAGANGHSKGATPLSPGEMGRLAAAVKADVTDIHHGRARLAGSQALTAYLLILAMRSGVNTTPLLELKRDCLRPHRLPNMKMLETVKHRGKQIDEKLLRQAESSVDSSPLTLDGVAILEHVLRVTSTLVDDAPAGLRDRVWLFRLETTAARGDVSVLDVGTLSAGIQSLVTRHGLQADDGKPLLLNLSRLRKTLEHRLWRLSDGDLVAVAALMGQSPQVADHDYLRLDDRTLAEAAVFIADEFTGALRAKGDSPDSTVALENTPAGRCRNTLYGDRAPKDGTNHCDQFVHCFGCPSFAIVGTVADLHRLFSYQAFLRAESAYFTSAEWDDWRARNDRIVAFIDRFVHENFPAGVVDEARRLTERAPHRFWAIRMEQAQSTRTAVGGTPDVR